MHRMVRSETGLPTLAASSNLSTTLWLALLYIRPASVFRSKRYAEMAVHLATEQAPR